MEEKQREKSEALLREVLGEQRPTATFHRLRAQVLEEATTLEFVIDELLTCSVARSASVAAQLQMDVFWRLPIPVRLGLLGDLLESTGLGERFPFVAPVLRRVFEFRHLLAHGFAEPVDLKERVLRIATVKKGHRKVSSFPLDEVAWLIRGSDQVRIELVTIWAGVVPDTEAWHEG